MKVYGPLRKAQLEKVTKPEDLNVPIDGRIFMDDTLTNPNDENSGKNTPTITQGTTNKEILLSGDAVIHGSANVADTPKPTGVSTSHIVPGSITTADLADGAVTTPKLQRAESIGAAFIQGGEPGAVEGTYDDANNVPIYGNIKPKSIGKYELKDKSVIESKLADDAVTEDKIANNAVTGAKIADYSAISADNSPGITTNKIAPNAVTYGKINSGSIDASMLRNNAVTTNRILNNAVTAPKLQKATKVLGPTETTSQKDDDGAVQGTYQDGRNPDNTPKYVFGNIKPHSIDRFELKNDCVTTEKINPGAVTKDKLDTNAVTTGKINSLAVTEDKLDTDAVTEDKIKNRSVTINKINTNAVTNITIDNDAVTGRNIRKDAVREDQIKDASVTAPKLQKATKVLGPTELTSQKDDDGAVQGTYQDGRNLDGTPKYVFGNIKPHSIDWFELKNDCVTTEKIESGAVTGGKLADYSAITSDNSPGITANKIADNAITAAKIADDAVTTDKIADKAVTRAKLSKAVTDELDTIGSGSGSGLASTGGAFLVATIGPLINKDNNPASSMGHPQDLNIRWVFDGAFPADRVDPTSRQHGIARPLNSYYLYSRPSNTRNGYLYIPIMHKDLNVIGYKIILEKKTGTDSNSVDIREPISQVFIPLPAALLVKSPSSNVWQTDIKDDRIIRAGHVLKINKTFPTAKVQTLQTNAIIITESITFGIGPKWPTLMGSSLSIGYMYGITGTPKIKLYLYEIRV